MSSPRIHDSDKQNVADEINPKMVMFSHEVGGSHSVLSTFGTVIGIPTMHLKTYQGHDKKITAAEIDAGSDLLDRTASAVRLAYADTDEDLQDAHDRGETPRVNIGVSFDVTWQKRGFTSLFGVGVCMDVLTGLVVDYSVLLKYCHGCKLMEARNRPAAELAAWRLEHATDCCKNHHLSSKAMEQEAAKVMWGRSVEEAGFWYVDMLSEGDSTAYNVVCDLKPYHPQQVINWSV